MYYVYILYSERKDGYYIGQTNDLLNRLDRHNRGTEFYTSQWSPWVLAWNTTKDTRSEAMVLERKLKNLNKTRLIAFIEKYS